MKIVTWVMLTLLMSGQVFGAEVYDIFENHFNYKFRDRFCGPNTQSLLFDIRESGISLEGYQVVLVTNEGVSMFGLVNAMAARGSRWNKPAKVTSNWYHHVFPVALGASGAFGVFSDCYQCEICR